MKGLINNTVHGSRFEVRGSKPRHRASSIEPQAKTILRMCVVFATLLAGCLAFPLQARGAQVKIMDTEEVRLAFARANARYRNRQFSDAAESYHAILAGGIESGTLYYNLGNAWLKSGRAADALWAYLKAQRLMPRDADLRANLQYVHSALGSSTEDLPPVPRIARIITLNHLFTTDELAGAFAAGFWVTALGWIAWAWVPRARSSLRPFAWIATGITGLISLLLAAHVWIDARPAGVILASPADVKFAPQPGGTTYFTLPEGAVVRILSHEPGWMQIRRGDGRAGWVAEDALRSL